MPVRRAIERVSDAIGNTASYLFLIIVAISAYEVVMRYAFEAPTIWVHELSVALAAAAFVIGGPVVHQRRQHIAITYFYDRRSPHVRAMADLLNSLLTVVFLAFLTLASARQAADALGIMETSGTALNWPIPTFLKTLFALCSLVMLLQTLGHIWNDIRKLQGRTR
jgi:TRAP-type mannitol/chloroaromatic compound transport system permease small subunit